MGAFFSKIISTCKKNKKCDDEKEFEQKILILFEKMENLIEIVEYNQKNIIQQTNSENSKIRSILLKIENRVNNINEQQVRFLTSTNLNSLPFL
jgi:hypothetical protein